MAFTGLPPRCEKCQSLERHRAIRSFWQQVYDKDLFRQLRVLQFSADSAVKPEWFSHYEYSVYGGHNSLDLQKVERESGSYDIVICNHVLEHVLSDDEALREMNRVVKDDGIVFLTVPDPIRRTSTNDWGYPDETQHGHYRLYGADIAKLFEQAVPSIMVFSTEIVDAVTQTPDIAFILARKQNRLIRRIAQAGCKLSLYVSLSLIHI